MAAAALSSASIVSAAPAALPSAGDLLGGVLGGINSGQATYYTTNGVQDGTCSFSGYTLPSSLFGTALSNSNWNNGANCGACAQVSAPGGKSIKAMIVDQCPGCGENHLDLFPDAFSELAALSVGVLDVQWNIVPCGIDSPLSLKAKDGSSQYWFSMQVVNSNLPIKALEVSTDGGNTWQETTRTYYNFFEKDGGFGSETVDVRVTSLTGDKLVVQNVNSGSNAATTATSNF
ncbi:CAZyme family CBM63 [Paecilomyces variotii]|nr:CAZyme family CBM63 [Paecilomyces variotii]